MRIERLVGFAVLAGFFTSAQAVSVICPNPGRIQQGADFSYSATAPNGRAWHGEQVGTAKVDPTTYTFKGASIAASTIACHYKGEDGAALTLKLSAERVEPGSQDKWGDGNCDSDKPTVCAFTFP